MALSIMGQQYIDGTTNTAATNILLATAGGSTGAIVGVLQVCNTEAVAKTYRVLVCPSGQTPAAYGSPADKYAQFYDAPLLPNESKTLQIPWTLGPGDKVYVASHVSKVSFGLFGVTDPA